MIPTSRDVVPTNGAWVGENADLRVLVSQDDDVATLVFGYDNRVEITLEGRGLFRLRDLIEAELPKLAEVEEDVPRDDVA